MPKIRGVKPSGRPTRYLSLKGDNLIFVITDRAARARNISKSAYVRGLIIADAMSAGILPECEEAAKQIETAP